MALYKQVVLTAQGHELLNDIIATSSRLEFTKVNSTSTVLTESSIHQLLNIPNIKQSDAIRFQERINDTTIKIEALFSNEGLAEDYEIRAIGVYAKDADGDEVLFGVSIAEEAFYMPAEGSGHPTGAIFRLNVGINNTVETPFTVDPAAMASMSDITRLSTNIGLIESEIDLIDAQIINNKLDIVDLKDKDISIESSISTLRTDLTVDKQNLVTLENKVNTNKTAQEQAVTDLDNRVTSQLAQKITKNRGAVTSADLSQEVKEQLTGGSVAVVGENTIMKENIVDGQVIPRKTDFAVEGSSTVNLVNLEDGVKGKAINGEGVIYNSASSYLFTIDVKPNTTYTQYGFNNGTHVEMDSDFNYIRGGVAGSTGFTTSPDTYSLVFPVPENYLDRLILVEGDVMPLYVPYKRGVSIPDFDYSNLELPEGIVEPVHTNFLIPSSMTQNLLDKDNPFITGRRFTAGGAFYDSDDGYVFKIWVKPNTNYVNGYVSGNVVLQYSLEGEFLGGHSTKTYKTFHNTRYILVYTTSVYLDRVIVSEGTVQPSYEPYIPAVELLNMKPLEPEKKFEGAIAGFIGDSIIGGGNSMLSDLQDGLGFSEIVNYGVGGTRIAYKDDFANEISTRYQDMRDDLDVVLVAGGTNDFSNAIPLGTMEDRENTTFYGACHTLFSGLAEKYPSSIIVAFTLIPRHNIHSPNRNGDTVFDYSDVMSEVSGYYGIRCFDITRNSDLRPYEQTNRNLYISDGLHPNKPEGYDLLGRQLVSLLKTV